jgi:hypothetical protein
MTQNHSENEAEDVEQYPAVEADRIAPGLLFDRIVLRQIERCQIALSKSPIEFAFCVEGLHAANIPRLSDEDRDRIDHLIDVEIDKIDKQYDVDVKNEYDEIKPHYTSNANTINKTALKEARGHYKYAHIFESALKEYELILEHGKIDKFFKIATEKQSL